jgi:dolichyl-phosphate-mannose--protein O-mannosyl transferase
VVNVREKKRKEKEMRTADPIKLPLEKKRKEEKNKAAEQYPEKEQPKEKVSEEMTEDSPFLDPLDWNGYDAFCLFILVFFGIFSRFWVIQYPRHFTDGEATHVQYINSYLNGSFFLMSQPPLAEMCLAGIAKFSYYKQSLQPPYYETNFTFPTMEYVALRSPSAFMSAIVIPLSFFIVRLLGSSTFGAMAAGLFTLFDFLLIGSARNIGTDGFLQLFVALTMFFTAFMKRLNRGTTAWNYCFFFQAFFCGCCISSNWACISLIIFIIIFNFTTYKDITMIPKTLFIITGVFVLTFFLHAILLPYKTGNEKLLSASYVNDLFQVGQQSKINYLRVPLHAFEIMHKSFKLHNSRSKCLPFFKWVTMSCPWKVLWTQLGRTVAVFGNLPVWWAISVAFIGELLKSILTRRLRDTSTLIFCGFIEILAYYMFCLSERGLSDYQTALLFGIWGLALSLDVELPPSASGFTIALLTVAAGIVFILWAPLVYGYENFDTRFLPYFAK